MDNSSNHTPNPKPKSPIRRLFQKKTRHCKQRFRYIDEVERIFRYIDENGDGRISPAELQSCIKTVAGGIEEVLTDVEAEAAVRSSDSDGDGYLSLEDLQRIMSAKEVPEEEWTAELREAFAMYEETAGSGCITARSLRKMMNRLGESKSVRDCQVMISKYDLNGDEVISFEEFAAMMH